MGAIGNAIPGTVAFLQPNPALEIIKKKFTQKWGKENKEITNQIITNRRNIFFLYNVNRKKTKER